MEILKKLIILLSHFSIVRKPKKNFSGEGTMNFGVNFFSKVPAENKFLFGFPYFEIVLFNLPDVTYT